MVDLLFEVKDRIATMTLNGSESYYAFSKGIITEWIKELETLRNYNDIRIVIVKDNVKSFCAGGNIIAMQVGGGFFKSEENIFPTG